MTVGIVPGLNSGSQTILIRKITITETPPPPTFTITPSTLTVPCSSTTPRNFIVNNVYNSPGTLSYDWDLGSSSNGWIYNGSAAPQTFTTSSNAITLTPNSNTLADVKVTVKLNTVAQPQLTSDITVSSNPGLNLTMNVPSNLCTSGNFTVNNLPGGATVSWSASPSGSVVIVPSGNSATISNGMSPGGEVDITATVTVSAGCTQQVVQNDIYFGSYPTTGTYKINSSGSDYDAQSVNYVPPYQTHSFTGYNFDALTTYSYSVTKLYGNATISGSNPYYFSLNPYSSSNPADGLVTFRVRATTNCGNIDQVFTFTTQGQCGECDGFFMISPNPASHTVKIKKSAAQTNGKQGTTNQIYKITVLDRFGTPVQAYSYSGVNEVTLNVSSLKTGVYVLKIFDGKKEHAQRLTITR